MGWISVVLVADPDDGMDFAKPAMMHLNSQKLQNEALCLGFQFYPEGVGRTHETNLCGSVAPDVVLP
jgi:hypothetical protein